VAILKSGGGSCNWDLRKWLGGKWRATTGPPARVAARGLGVCPARPRVPSCAYGRVDRWSSAAGCQRAARENEEAGSGKYRAGVGRSERGAQSVASGLDRVVWPCLQVIGALRVRFFGAVGRLGPMAENIIWYRRVIYPHTGGDSAVFMRGARATTLSCARSSRSRSIAGKFFEIPLKYTIRLRRRFAGR